jgi:acyl-coenzyme A thioesterase PaaI-like protein
MDHPRTVHEPDRTGTSHVVAELGLRLDHGGERFAGQGEVYAEACVPGTDVLRTSVLATWADVLTGAVAGHGVAPHIPLTLDLEVQVVAPIRLGTTVTVDASPIRVGRTIVVTSAQFSDAATGRLLATAFASFVPSPDPAAVFADGFPKVVFEGRLSVPLAERIGSRVVGPGTVEVPHRPDGLNAVGAIQGGLLAFAVEEAAASLTGAPVLAESLVLRYLRPFMVGPARAVAAGDGPGVSVVDVSDAGAGKLGLVATIRTRSLA